MCGTRALAVLLASAAIILGLPTTVRATVQSKDLITIKGKLHWMMECPLGDLLWTLPEELEFDEPSTANHKGYTAKWEIKDGELLLVSFEAKRDGQKVPLETILPGRKLPTRADWFSRQIRIPIGELIKGNNDSGYGNRYERGIVLHVVRGKVVKEEELKNYLIKSYRKEREEENARHWQWVFPRLPIGTVTSRSQPIYMRKICSITVTPETLLRTPVCPNGPDEPPLSSSKAKLLAESRIRKLPEPVSKYKWELTKSEIKHWIGKHYYYELDFKAEPLSPFAAPNSTWLQLLVLMDGTVPEPVIWDIGDYVRASRGGAWEVDKVLWGGSPSVWERPYVGAPWSDLSWRSRLSLLGAIVAAPKLLYELHGLEIYSNGMWADFSVANGSNKVKYVHTAYLNIPIRKAGLWDSADEKWSVVVSKQEIGPAELNHYTAIEPWQTIRFRALIDRQHFQHLEPFGLIESKEPRKPKSLEYHIAAWPSASINLKDASDSEVQVFAFGHGRVPVTWFDKKYPEDWPAWTRLSKYP